MKTFLLTIAALVAIGFAAYLIASTGIRSQAGYAQLTHPRGSISDLQISINVGPAGLKPVQWLVRKIAEHSDQPLELEEQVLLGVLEDMDGVQLRIYRSQEKRERYEQAIKATVDRLSTQKWETVVRARDGEQNVVVMHREENGLTAGVLVLASTPEKSVFANFIGAVDLAKFADYTSSLEPSN